MRCYFGNFLGNKLGTWGTSWQCLGNLIRTHRKTTRIQKKLHPQPHPPQKNNIGPLECTLAYLIRYLLALILYLVFFSLFFFNFDLTYILPSKVVLLMTYEPPPWTYIFTTYLSTYLSTSLSIYYYLCTYLSISLPIFNLPINLLTDPSTYLTFMQCQNQLLKVLWKM